jgi:hypothetical protein
MRKCDMCYERQSRGEADRLRCRLPDWAPPSAASANALIAEAHQRIADKPDRYFRQDLRSRGSGRNLGVVLVGRAV